MSRATIGESRPSGATAGADAGARAHQSAHKPSTADEGGADAHAPSGRPTHQHPVTDGDVYSSLAVDHMRSMQAAVANTRQASPAAAEAHISTRSTIGSGVGMIGQLLGEQGQAAPRLASDSGRTMWQDPQVYLMAVKSSLQYHDIADFISKHCV